MIPETMKAVVLTGPARGDEVSLTEYPVPKVRPGWVLVKVKAFGMNHSEQILRQGEIRADYIQKPLVPGIECVGEIADPSTVPLKRGRKWQLLWAAWGGVSMEAMESMLSCLFIMCFPLFLLFPG